MSYEQRQTYRKRKRLIRRIQVYGEIAVITVLLLLAGGFLVNKITKHDSKISVAAENKNGGKAKEAKKEKKDEKGLKVSAKAAEDPDAKPAEGEDTETPAEEQKTSIGTYSATKTDDTATITGDVVSNYAILINNDTKQIVGSLNGTDRIVPASMTKVMTVLTAARHIKPEQLDEKVTLSHEAVDFSYAGGGSTSGFTEGEEITVRDLFYGTILPSGGDAATQLAMYVAGDVDTFVGMMNDEVSNLGLSDTTHFTNPVGFHNEDHYSTPYDIAIIMMAALDNDICKEVIKTKVYQSSASNINPEGLTISNWFLRRIEDKDIGGTIEAAKTGYVDESGSCAVSAMTTEGGTEYILCTAKSASSWRCINDHVSIYKTYAK